MMLAAFACAAAILLAIFFVFQRRAHLRRKAFFDAPFPKKWASVLRRDVPVYAFLPRDLRENFHRRIKEFLSEKFFEPCGGLHKVSEETALVIAAGASLLVMNRGGRAWRTLHSVLVYPSAFAAPEGVEDANGGDDGGSGISVVVPERGERDGESWAHGSVVFSHERIMRDIAFHGNGQNVILHEFAHQLDAFDNGLPRFPDPADTRAWQRVAAAEIARLRSRDPSTVLDEYGDENPAEFFAVSVEAFFEKSSAMKRAHPELYALLTRFFALDPASWGYS